MANLSSGADPFKKGGGGGGGGAEVKLESNNQPQTYL